MAEGVGAAPGAGDVEDLPPSDLLRKGRIHQEMAPDRLQAEHGALDGPLHVLVLKDLSRATWRALDSAALGGMRRGPELISQVAAPECVPSFPALTGWWAKVAADPSRFLASNTASSAWLNRALPLLAETRGGGTGRMLMHYDLHCANICFQHRHAKMVDWGLADRGYAYDWGYLTLHARFFGGSRPTLVLRHEPETAAIIAGGLACRPWGAAEAWSSAGLRLLVRAYLLEALRWVSARPARRLPQVDLSTL